MNTTTTREAYLAAVNVPGAFQSVEWTSTVKPAAAHKARTLTKVSTAVVRTGIDFANLGVNSDRETGALPWGQWAEDAFPYIVEHKGSDFARLYVNDGSVRTTYFVDGLEVARDEFNQYLTPSARNPKRPTGGTITVRMASLVLR